jgi:hypothetical protein
MRNVRQECENVFKCFDCEIVSGNGSGREIRYPNEKIRFERHYRHHQARVVDNIITLIVTSPRGRESRDKIRKQSAKDPELFAASKKRTWDHRSAALMRLKCEKMSPRGGGVSVFAQVCVSFVSPSTRPHRRCYHTVDDMRIKLHRYVPISVPASFRYIYHSPCGMVYRLIDSVPATTARVRSRQSR